MEPYDEFVQRILKPGTHEENLIHGALGIGGEAGEVVDIIKKNVIYDKEFQPEKLCEELGDLLFYMQVVMNEIGVKISDVIWMNQDKLNKRFGSGVYSNQEAIARADQSS